MLHREFLSDIVSRCVPGRVHLLALLAAGIISAAMTDISARRTAFLHLSLAAATLLLVEQSIAGLSVQVIPWLTYLQFPWRFLALFNLFASVSFASCLSKSSPLPERWRYALGVAVPLLSVAVYLKHLPPQEATRFPTRDREGIRSSMTTLDHENKYLPVGAKIFDKPAPRVLLEVPDGECYETEVHPNDYRFRVSARSAQPATFHQYFFRGWRAEVDGFPRPLQRDSSGLCRVEIPAGVHEVRLRFARTPLHAAALVVSATAWTGVLVTVAIVAVRSVYRARRGGRGSGPCQGIGSSPLPPAS